jgi:hypothetical protein
MKGEHKESIIFFWTRANEVYAKHDIMNVQFHVFISNAIQVNWLAIRRVYGGYENIFMKN